MPNLTLNPWSVHPSPIRVNRISIGFLLGIFLLGAYAANGQDKIYLLDDSGIDAKVQRVDKKVWYTKAGDPKAKKYKIPRKKVGIIRYQSGLLHVFGAERERQLPFNQGDNDRILLVSGQVLPIELKGIFANHIEYVSLSDPKRELNSTPKSGALGLFQKDKPVIFYGTVSKLIPSLLRAEELPIQPELKNPEPTPSTPIPLPSTSGNGERPPVLSNSDPFPSSKKDNPFMKIDEEEFKRKALEKTRRLNQYISLISNKATPIMEANQAVSQAITLFIGDSCIVQVSNVKRPQAVRDFYIRQYLENIKLLKYDRVEIEWVDINYVGEVRKGVDGNYYGTITFIQKFRGISDNRVIYEDKTYKRVEVVLKTYGKNIMGSTQELWDVFLSNIKVDHTTSY